MATSLHASRGGGGRHPSASREVFVADEGTSKDSQAKVHIIDVISVPTPCDCLGAHDSHVGAPLIA